MSVLVRGLHGLGDNFMQRPFVRALANREVTYLATPWPQLYKDLPQVKCVNPMTTLRTQYKNQIRDGHMWHKLPREGVDSVIEVTYGPQALARGSIFDHMERIMPLQDQPFIYDGALFDDALPFTTDKPIAIIRPATLRKEWRSASRNCKPEYLAMAATILAELGYCVVSVADLEHGQEWALDPLPFAHETFHKGELTVEQLMSLVHRASVMVAPVGWALPVCLAYHTPLVLIGGGRGQHNAPWIVTDPRQDTTNLRWIMPDRYCMCEQPDHECTKDIHNFSAKFKRTVGQLGSKL